MHIYICMCAYMWGWEWMCLDASVWTDLLSHSWGQRYSTKRFEFIFSYRITPKFSPFFKAHLKLLREPSLTHKKGLSLPCRLLQVAIWAIHDHRIMTNYLIITWKCTHKAEISMPQQRLPRTAVHRLPLMKEMVTSPSLCRRGTGKMLICRIPPSQKWNLTNVSRSHQN